MNTPKKQRLRGVHLLDQDALVDSNTRLDTIVALSVRTGERYSRDLNERESSGNADPWAMAQRSLR